jgi:hypothetical protein
VRRVSEAWKVRRSPRLRIGQNPREKYRGLPKMPRYKHSLRGRNVVVYSIDALSKPALVKGIVKLSQTDIEFHTQAKNVDPTGEAVPTSTVADATRTTGTAPEGAASPSTDSTKA